MDNLRVVLGNGATTPMRFSGAGYDLYLPKLQVDEIKHTYQGDDPVFTLTESGVNIFPGKSVLLNTRVKMAIPDGWVGFIKDRSSVAYKMQLVTDAGVIDSCYRDEVYVLIHNEGNFIRTIEWGSRFAQMVLLPHGQQTVQVVESLEATERKGGFGSTGTGVGS